jgi:hypothetical protein
MDNNRIPNLALHTKGGWTEKQKQTKARSWTDGVMMNIKDRGLSFVKQHPSLIKDQDGWMKFAGPFVMIVWTDGQQCSISKFTDEMIETEL